ncbi:phage tail protein [Enterovibrio nigricans]|uniref:p2 phage tail completion protein R (GpR) n=1 Tax=Enterovibrio nigricans DSM 22720 TaxID=1121868 RepID=A0A1T4UF25_9GAMM|nr:phage tail protein [Enterovibrio nigricans]SKA51206.1 P2 phage tail completion protein R (GpR) [Enterovibrio nigricans DSM 22720]
MADAYTKTKLQHLTEYVVKALKTSVLDNKIDAWQENAKIVINGDDRGHGIRIAEWQYNAVISIEGFPHHLLDPRYLLAAVACWISEFDHERSDLELEDPTLAVDILDEGTVDVTIELELSEPIEMIPDPNGLIEYQGETYRVQTVPVDVAEEAEISNETDG